MDMKEYARQVTEALEAIEARVSGVPRAALILGSGLGMLAEAVEDPVVIPYAEIPHWKTSTAPGHAGRLVCGTLSGVPVVVMQGRLHCYEGYTPQETTFPIRVFGQWGVKTLLVTNASGGINYEYANGDVALITDHIKFFMDSPLRGKNLDEFGTRFPDATHLYTPRLQDVARSVAKAQGLDLKEGVYMYFPGPSYETPAEIRAIRTLGADLVGMSTVPEVLAAGHAGMEVLGFSLVSNAAAGIVEGATLSEQEVLDAAAAAKERFSQLICDCVENM